MFFGAVIKPGQSVVAPEERGEILHLSQACLDNPKGNGKTRLQLTDREGTSYTLCVLTKDTCEHTSFDLFIPTREEIKMSVVGPNSVHLTGYYEPEGAPSGLDFDDEDSDEDEDDEAQEAPELEELMSTAQALPAKKPSGLMPASAQNRAKALAASVAKGNQSQKAKVTPSDSEDDDEDDNEDGDDEGKLATGDDSSSDDDEDDDDEDDDMDNEAMMQAIRDAGKKAAASAVAGKSQQSQPGNKRKTPATAAPISPPAPKKQKKEAANEDSVAKVQAAPKAPSAAPAAGDDSSKYHKSLVEYITSHGRTAIAQLGSQVKRPATVKKLGAFVKDHPETFKIDSGFVSLVKP